MSPMDADTAMNFLPSWRNNSLLCRYHSMKVYSPTIVSKAIFLILTNGWVLEMQSDISFMNI